LLSVKRTRRELIRGKEQLVVTKKREVTGRGARIEAPVFWEEGRVGKKKRKKGERKKGGVVAKGKKKKKNGSMQCKPGHNP